MGIIGHGIDVVEVSRIKAELESPTKRWVEKVYSHDEWRRPTRRLCITATSLADLLARKRS